MHGPVPQASPPQPQVSHSTTSDDKNEGMLAPNGHSSGDRRPNEANGLDSSTKDDIKGAEARIRVVRGHRFEPQWPNAQGSQIVAEWSGK